MEQSTSSHVDGPPPPHPSPLPSIALAPPEEEAPIATRPRSTSHLSTCWLFEPHEWKPAICRNCFCSLVAHELDVAPVARAHQSALLKPGSRRSRRIRVPHYETFEFKLREKQEQEQQQLHTLHKLSRSPRGVPVEDAPPKPAKLESEDMPAAAASASSPPLPVPVPETSSHATTTTIDGAGEAKGDGNQDHGKEEPQHGEGKVEAEGEAGDGETKVESAEKKDEVDVVAAPRPDEKAVGTDVGEEKGEVGAVRPAAQAEEDDAPRRLREALAVIDKLRAKIARKNGRLEEAEEEVEEVRNTLKSRMYDLLKEAAETEKTQKQLMDERTQAWQGEKEALEKLVQEQAQALQREKEEQQKLREEQAQAWQREKDALEKLIEEQTQAWQREKETQERAMEERAQAWQREKETQERLLEEQAQAWQREKEFWMQETSTVKRAFTLLRRQSMIVTAKPQQPAPVLPQAEAKRVTYDEQAVRACQSIVRSWLARRRGTRLITLVRAYSVSPHAKTQRRRFATIREFIQSERNYTEMIQHAIEHYMLPLRDKAEFEASTFSCDDVESLFNNMEMLAIISQQFLQALEQRFASTDKFTCYGDIILKFQAVLPLYSVYYRKYEETNEQLQRLSENEEFSQYVDELQKNSTYNPMLDLKVYLYRPCQRIPQYSMLLKQLLSYTPGEHVDYSNIMTATERIQTILALLNRRTEVEHSKRKMQELLSKVTGYDKNLADDRTRRFVEEDDWTLLLNVHADPGNTRKLANTTTKSLMSFVRRPNSSTDLKTVPASQQTGSLKVKLVRVFILSDMLLFAKSLGNGTYRFKFSIPLGGAVVTEMQGSDNTLLIRAKGGADRFFLFKDAAERRKWTAKLWPMILMLSADGRVKPDMRRKMNRGQHMRLTHIGMTNLMKVSMGQELGETPELDHPQDRDGETSLPGASSTRQPLPVVAALALGGISAEPPAEEVVEIPAVLLSSQTKLLSPRSPRPPAVPTGAAGPGDADVSKEKGSSSNNQNDKENEAGGSSSERRGSSVGEGKDERRERRQSTVRRKDEDEEQHDSSPRKRERTRRDKKLPPVLRGSDRDRDHKRAHEPRSRDGADAAGSPARPPNSLARPPHPSSAWLAADHDGDRSRQRRTEEPSPSSLMSRRLSTSSIRSDGRQSDGSRASRPAKSPSSGKYATLTGKTHHGSGAGGGSTSSSSSTSKERDKKPAGSSCSHIVRGRTAGPGSRSGGARDGGEDGSRSSEIRAVEGLVRKRTRSNSFDEATIQRFVGAAKLATNSNSTTASSALIKTTAGDGHLRSPRRRSLKRSNSANDLTPSGGASPRTDDDDDGESDELSVEPEEDSRRKRRSRVERKSSTATDRRGSKAGLRG